MQIYLIPMGVSSENLHHGRFHLRKMVSVLVQTCGIRTTFFRIEENSERFLGTYPKSRNQNQYKIPSFIWEILLDTWLKFGSEENI